MAAESPEAKARAEAVTQRMKMRGSEPGWSLHLNPTPALVEELGYPNGDALRRAVRIRERVALEQHQRGVESRGRDRSEDGPSVSD
jgi:hypothetical protein